MNSLKELFPDWADQDLRYVLDEAHGDIDLAITRISEGLFGFYRFSGD